MGGRRLLFFGLLAALLCLSGASAPPVSAEGMIAKLASGAVPAPHYMTSAGIRKTAPMISGGVAETALEQLPIQKSASAPVRPGGITMRTLGCSDRTSFDNVRVNQDCTNRRQAEQLIKVNPIDSNNLIAGQNDSRVGFNHCGFAYSLNGGRTWGDGQPPFFQHLNNPTAGHTVAGGPATNHTYDAASDPALAFDSQGRAFYSCILFDVNTNASAVAVAASIPGAAGSFYNNVPAAGTSYIAAEDNAGPTSQVLASHDKEFIAADSFPGSPNRDNVYVTWTVFKFSTSCGTPPDGTLQFCSNAIYGSMSTDHALTWSKPAEISGSSPLCFNGNFFDPSRAPNTCDLDQGSDPMVRSNGDLTVIFNNGNTAPTNPNAQQLAINCHPTGSSTAGTASLNCAAPAKVGDDVVSTAPACDFGRGPEECIPGAFIRTNDFPRIGMNRDNGTLFATWQDFRNGEFDVQLATSQDGVTWTDATNAVNPDRGTDHYFPAVDVVASANSKNHVAVSYFRTTQVPGESNGGQFKPGQPGVQGEPSDYSLAGGRNLGTPFTALPVSPQFAPPDGNQVGFNGDYSGLVVVGNRAHPLWSDTRNVAPAGVTDGTIHDEDTFTADVRVPG